MIDANGIVRGAIASGEAGRLDGFIPKAKSPTLFSQYGNTIPLVLAALLIALALGLPRLLALVPSRR